ncbi:hypothetical protein M9Y10_044746 [Tritrichomonas musculus]|uniref:Small GTP-binding protein n=1 Tax=Tritrichomonas musculus TaxID=1915356 RepID=A0ABR2JTL2_9EUKA
MPILEFKVVIIGSVAVGKTSITNRIQYNQFEEEYQATIGAGYTPYKTSFNGKDVELQIWDTAGMERYKSLGPIYYRDAVAAIIVYDQTDQESANAIKTWYEAFRSTVKTQAVIIIVGNKDDLDNKIVANEPIKKWAEENGFGFLLTSAKTGSNITELFRELVKRLVESQKTEMIVPDTNSVHVKDSESSKSPSSCC